MQCTTHATDPDCPTITKAKRRKEKTEFFVDELPAKFERHLTSFFPFSLVFAVVMNKRSNIASVSNSSNARKPLRDDTKISKLATVTNTVATATTATAAKDMRG